MPYGVPMTQATTPPDLALLHERDRLLRRLRVLARSNLFRGSLSLVERTCGKPNCACATEGRKHPGRSLSVKLDGRTRLISIAAEQEADVRRALAVYRKIAKTIDDLTVVNFRLLQQSRPPRRRRGAPA
jgi:hypothetical protein